MENGGTVLEKSVYLRVMAFNQEARSEDIFGCDNWEAAGSTW